jgi:hypothetical protein
MPMADTAADAESQLGSKSGKDQVVKIARFQLHQHLINCFFSKAKFFG